VLKALLTRKEQAILIFLVGSLFVGGTTLWWQRSRASGITVTRDEVNVTDTQAEDAAPNADDVADPDATSTDAPKEVTAETETQASKITISVAGAVNAPGVYRVPAGSVVEDAVIAAGGYAEHADPAGINRAAKLIDGTTLNVPVKAGIYVGDDSRPVLRGGPETRNIPAYMPGSVPRAASAPAPVAESETASGGRININTASSDELETLPRIGPKTAAAIIKYRSRQPFTRIEDIQNVPRIGPKTFDGLKHLITVSGE
jgi:competence protein ComEA